MSCQLFCSRTGLLGVLLYFALALPTHANTVYTLPPPGLNVIGHIQVVHARYEDTLIDIAREHGLGMDEIIAANPGVDLWLPGAGTPIILPTRHILPDAPRRGVVLNLAEKRLYYYPDPQPGAPPVVFTYPAGIGRMNWETPLGQTRITAKAEQPSWYPPESIRRDRLQTTGEVLPNVVPPGPDNPLGPYALRLGMPGYLIHGTNKQYGIGSRVSAGCVRLYNHHVEELFDRVPVGTPVTIINQPVKVGIGAGGVFMQVFAPFDLLGESDQDGGEAPTLADAEAILQETVSPVLLERINPLAVQLIVEQASGLVVPISTSNAETSG